MRNKIIFYLNGQRCEEGADKAPLMLAEYLRYHRSLTGTKIVCAEGDCGACSVLRLFPKTQGLDSQNYQPINSCIMNLAQLDGSSLVTVDALKKEGGELHETQRALVECHGSQCGFCTPGFVMAITGLVEEKKAKQEISITPQEAKNCMTGNLCRCTGYLPIINAVLDIDLNKDSSIKERFYSKEQESELHSVFQTGLHLESVEFTFFAPKTIKEAIHFLVSHPDTRIIGSATDLGVVHNKRKLKLQKLLSLHLIEHLYEMRFEAGEITFGARVSLSQVRHFLKDKLPEFSNYLDVFASPQIKNVGTLVGNVANASPIGDTPPALLALRARVLVEGPKGKREIPMEQFFLAYRKTDLREGEIITGIIFPRPKEDSSVRFFKNANRKDLDISAVNLAIHVEWKDRSKKEIQDISLAAGGIAATPLRLFKTEDFLKTHALTKSNLDLAIHQMQSEFVPLSDLRASASYRRILVENFFRRFFAETGTVV